MNLSLQTPKRILTRPQAAFIRSEAAHPAMVAGLGAGKTHAGIVRLVMKMLKESTINTAFYLPTYDLLKLRAVPGTEEFLSEIGIPFTTNRSDYAIKLKGYGSMILRSYDRPERIVAYEVAHSIVDELDTLPKEKAAFVWRKISERNRQKCQGKNTIGQVTTPDQGFSGFTYDRWVKNKKPGYELIKAGTASNPFLPDGYIEQIRANYDPLLADMYINGEFVNLKAGKVYYQFDRAKNHSNATVEDGDILHIGMDFNVWNMSAVVHVYREGYPVAVDEITDGKDTPQMIRVIKERYKNNRIIIYPDASGKSANTTNASSSDLSLLIEAGFKIDAPKANPRVRDRVVSMNAMFCNADEERRYKVNTDKCKEYAADLEQQVYDKNGEPDKKSGTDHKVDAAGYFINRKHPARMQPRMTIR